MGNNHISSNTYIRRNTCASKDALNESLELKVQNNLDEYFIYKKRFITVTIIAIVFHLANLCLEYYFGEYKGVNSLIILISNIKDICGGKIEVEQSCKGKCRMPKYEKLDPFMVDVPFIVIIVLLKIWCLKQLNSNTKKVATHTEITNNTYDRSYVKNTYLGDKLIQSEKKINFETTSTENHIYEKR